MPFSHKPPCIACGHSVCRICGQCHGETCKARSLYCCHVRVVYTTFSLVSTNTSEVDREHEQRGGAQ